MCKVNKKLNKLRWNSSYENICYKRKENMQSKQKKRIKTKLWLNVSYENNYLTWKKGSKVNKKLNYTEKSCIEIIHIKIFS